MDEELEQFIKSYVMATSGKRGNDVINDQSRKNLPAADKSAVRCDEKEQGNGEDGKNSADLINITEFHSLNNLDGFGTPVNAGFQDLEWKFMELDDLAEFDSIQDVTNQFSAQTVEPIRVYLPDKSLPVHFGASNLETGSGNEPGLKDARSAKGVPNECGEASKANKRKIKVATKKVKKPRILSAYTHDEKSMTEMDYDEAMLIWESLKSQGLDKFKRQNKQGIEAEAREMKEKVKSFPVAFL